MTAIQPVVLLPIGVPGPRPRQRGEPGAQPVMLDDHSKVDPLLPIPNRTVKRLRADDSGWTSVKVGHRQALMQNPRKDQPCGGFFMGVPCQ